MLVAQDSSPPKVTLEMCLKIHVALLQDHDHPHNNLRHGLIRSDSGTLALQTEDFSKIIGHFSKTQNKGFTKTIPGTENLGKIRRRTF